MMNYMNYRYRIPPDPPSVVSMLRKTIEMNNYFIEALKH